MKSKIQKSHRNKYKKHISCRYSYILVCADDKFSKPFKKHLSKDVVYSFINNVMEQIRYCRKVVKEYFNKELVMTKEGNEDFNNSAKCWICDNDYVENDVKVRDHCHITRKCRGSEHRDENINLKLVHKIPIVFHNLRY